MRNKRNHNAVSELLGTMLLLFIAVAAFSVIYFYLASDNGPAPQTYVTLVGEIDAENVVLTHKGGESLDAKDTISFTVGGEKRPYLIEEYLIDTNGNGKWDLGEKIVYDDFIVDLHYLDQYEFVDVQAIDGFSNTMEFHGPIFTNYRSDVGLLVKVNNSFPGQYQLINITINAWCNGGDVAAAGGVKINCSLPASLDFVSYSAEQGTYNNVSGMWNLGNLLVEDSPVNLSIIARVVEVPYHDPAQLGLIFEGSEYTSGSVSVWQNTYLNGLKFALDDGTIFPHDGSVELTVVSCGGESLPLAKVELSPTIITESNCHPIGQDLRNTPYPGGYAPISSGIRLVTDQMYHSANFITGKRQVVLIVTSGNPDCIWDKTTAGGYGGIVTSDKTQVKIDTINAGEYLNSRFEFNESNDELNAIAVAKTVDLRNSTLFNESIVIPKPGNIYNITTPITQPGWVFEVEPGKDEFQEAFSLIIKMLLNSIKFKVFIDDSTTIDPNPNNNYYEIHIQPIFV